MVDKKTKDMRLMNAGNVLAALYGGRSLFSLPPKVFAEKVKEYVDELYKEEEK